jgi:hypothetical protein
LALVALEVLLDEIMGLLVQTLFFQQIHQQEAAEVLPEPQVVVRLEMAVLAEVLVLILQQWLVGQVILRLLLPRKVTTVEVLTLWVEAVVALPQLEEIRQVLMLVTAATEQPQASQVPL